MSKSTDTQLPDHLFKRADESADEAFYLQPRFVTHIDDATIEAFTQYLGETLQSKGGALLQSILSSALGVLNVLVLLFIVPVVAFYLLLDWDHMIKRIDDLLPREHAPVIRRLASDINEPCMSTHFERHDIPVHIQFLME